MKQHPNITIRQIQPAEIDHVATLLTDAFHDNPAYAAVFKNKNRLREGLHWLFRASLLMNNEKQPLTNVITDNITGEIIGTFAIIPPEGVKNSISIYSRLGIARFISRFGAGTLIRMLTLDAKNKKILADSLGNLPHYYLSMVVISEKYRGKGIGSIAIKQAIERLSQSNPSCALIGLTTQLPENVTFYSRLGFTLLDEGFVDFRESRYYNYNMKREMKTTIEEPA